MAKFWNLKKIQNNEEKNSRLNQDMVNTKFWPFLGSLVSQSVGFSVLKDKWGYISQSNGQI